MNRDQNDDFVVINGKLTPDDVLDKGILGKKGIIQQIHNMYGRDACCDFLNQTQILITKWMAEHSFTISFEDAILEKKGRDEILEAINKNINKANDLIIQAQQGIYKRQLSQKLMMESLESELTACANKGTEESKKLLKNILKIQMDFTLPYSQALKVVY